MLLLFLLLLLLLLVIVMQLGEYHESCHDQTFVQFVIFGLYLKIRFEEVWFMIFIDISLVLERYLFFPPFKRRTIKRSSNFLFDIQQFDSRTMFMDFLIFFSWKNISKLII